MMIKEDCVLLNRILAQMQILTERLDESVKAQDYQKVMMIKKQLATLQEKVKNIL